MIGDNTSPIKWCKARTKNELGQCISKRVENVKIHAIGWTTSKIRRSTGKAGENHPTTKINGERQPHEGQCRKVGSPTQPCRKSKINGPRRNRILAVTSKFKRITLCWLCRNYYMEFRSTVYNALQQQPIQLPFGQDLEITTWNSGVQCYNASIGYSQFSCL